MLSFVLLEKGLFLFLTHTSHIVGRGADANGGMHHDVATEHNSRVKKKKKKAKTNELHIPQKVTFDCQTNNAAPAEGPMTRLHSHALPK